MTETTTYEKLFETPANPFSAVSALLPPTISPADLHAYMTNMYGHTPVYDDTTLVTGLIVSVITANSDRYAKISTATYAALSPTGAVDLTETTTHTGSDTHSTAHTGEDGDTITKSGRDTTETHAGTTDKTATYDNATLQDVSQAVQNGGGTVTYGTTTSTTRTHGTTDTTTDTLGTTHTKTTKGTNGNQAESLSAYMRAINYSLMEIIISDVLPAISLHVYIPDLDINYFC